MAVRKSIRTKKERKNNINKQKGCMAVGTADTPTLQGQTWTLIVCVDVIFVVVLIVIMCVLLCHWFVVVVVAVTVFVNAIFVTVVAAVGICC